MKAITTFLELDGEQKQVTIQEMDVVKNDGSDLYLLHSNGNLIAVISIDGSCAFEVIDGDFQLAELKPVCEEIKRFRLNTLD